MEYQEGNHPAGSPPPLLKRHPLSALFPDLSDQEFRELVADVRANGVHEPITVHDDQVLDGWHRYDAAVRAGVDYPLDFYEGDDPAGYVISRNVMRRHLTAMERAKVVASVRSWAPPGKPRQDGGVTHTTAQMAAEANTGNRTMERAKAEVLRERDNLPVPPPRKHSSSGEGLTHKQRLIDRVEHLEGQVGHLREQLARYEGPPPEPSALEQQVDSLKTRLNALLADRDRDERVHRSCRRKLKRALEFIEGHGLSMD